MPRKGISRPLKGLNKGRREMHWKPVQRPLQRIARRPLHAWTQERLEAVQERLVKNLSRAKSLSPVQRQLLERHANAEWRLVLDVAAVRSLLPAASVLRRQLEMERALKARKRNAYKNAAQRKKIEVQLERVRAFLNVYRDPSQAFVFRLGTTQRPVMAVLVGRHATKKALEEAVSRALVESEEHNLRRVLDSKRIILFNAWNRMMLDRMTGRMKRRRIGR